MAVCNGVSHDIRPGGPNILITGTPGTGKSSLGRELAERAALNYVNIGELAAQQQLYTGYDNEYQCPILDEDMVIDELESTMCQGGNVLDYHGCEFFPERWFDGVFVLRTETNYLHDRLTARGYAGKKLEENMQCEIFQTILEEARESYHADIVHELPSNTSDDLEENLEKLELWLVQWKANHGMG